jgi:YqjK-like protein
MSNRLQELADRRRVLVAQSDGLRLQLAKPAQGLEQVLGIADLGVAAGRYIRQRPLLLLAIGAAVLIVKPRPALRTLSLALTSLSIFGQLRRVLPVRR